MLCQRAMPIFVEDTDNLILRLPERFMPPFLLALKQEFLNKKKYLRYLRINSRVIKQCACEGKFAHSYCATAFVLMNHKINCNECGSYYMLYVKSGKVVSNQLVQNFFVQAIYFGILTGFVVGIYHLDKYLKQRAVKDTNEQINNEYELLILMIVLVVIMIWCFYLRFIVAFMKRNRL